VSETHSDQVQAPYRQNIMRVYLYCNQDILHCKYVLFTIPLNMSLRNTESNPKKCPVTSTKNSMSPPFRKTQKIVCDTDGDQIDEKHCIKRKRIQIVSQ
jgi:hypothetical protein